MCRVKTIKQAFAAALVALVVSPAVARDMPAVDPSDIVAKYGKPDSVQSTEHDKPRPPLVTRMLEYKKERVRFALLADAPVGSPPPYKSWRLIGTQDPIDNAVISAEEAERRLQPRLLK